MDMAEKFEVDDIVTVNAKVIAISEAGNPIIQFPCGVKCLIKARDVVKIKTYGFGTRAHKEE